MTELSTLAENYLKAIWSTGEWDEKPVTVGGLAARLGFSPSSVSEAIRKLTDLGLVTHAKYQAVELTDAGRDAAIYVVRKHRLIETFLVDYLGYTWDAVHDEAEVLEHAVSDDFVERLAARLGEPTRDPHGDPIPRRDGTLPALDAIPLAEAAIGRAMRVGQVSDADSELLRYFEDLGIRLDQILIVHGRHDAAGTMTVEHGDTTHVIGTGAARAIRVTSA